MEKLKTGIIGCGKVGDFHAKAFEALENSEFTAVCDNNIERARAFADRYGVKAYDDIEAMIRECGLDVVSICTPHPLQWLPRIAAATCSSRSPWLPAWRTATGSSRPGTGTM